MVGWRHGPQRNKLPEASHQTIEVEGTDNGKTEQLVPMSVSELFCYLFIYLFVCLFYCLFIFLGATSFRGATVSYCAIAALWFPDEGIQ
jgi:hypothetical protein